MFMFFFVFFCFFYGLDKKHMWMGRVVAPIKVSFVY